VNSGGNDEIEKFNLIMTSQTSNFCGHIQLSKKKLKKIKVS